MFDFFGTAFSGDAGAVPDFFNRKHKWRDYLYESLFIGRSEAVPALNDMIKFLNKVFDTPKTDGDVVMEIFAGVSFPVPVKIETLLFRDLLSNSLGAPIVQFNFCL